MMKNRASLLALFVLAIATVLMVFFILLSLSTSGISNFSVVALMQGYALPFSTANLALTAFLTASAFGVLGGGFVADLTRRHGDVAAAGFAANAVIMLLIATIGFAPPVLIAVMGPLRHDHAVSRHAGPRGRPAGRYGPRLRHRHDGVQHRRHGRADAVRLDHGSRRPVLGVRRQRGVHVTDGRVGVAWRAPATPATAMRRPSCRQQSAGRGQIRRL